MKKKRKTQKSLKARRKPIVLAVIFGIIAILLILAILAVIYLSAPSQNVMQVFRNCMDKCVLDKQDIDLCQKECEAIIWTSFQKNNTCIQSCIATGKQPQICLQQCLCGDGICDKIELQQGSCQLDCKQTAVTNATPGSGSLMAFEPAGEFTYSTISGNSLMLNLFLPKEKTGEKMPVVIEIHGGAFTSGDKKPSLFVGFLTSKGIAVASVNYRLANDSKYPAAVDDVKNAVKWLEDNADTYNLDTENFGAIGMSSGGYLASMLGVSGEVKAVVDLFGQANFSSITKDREEAGLQPSDIESFFLGCSSLSSCSSLAADASPINHISSDDAAFLILHRENDGLIPLKQSQDFNEALQNAGVTSELIVIPVNQPGRSLLSDYSDEMVSFFEEHLK